MLNLKKKKVLIVGGGTAGLIIANRLQVYFDVTVIEKSKYKNYPLFYKVPALIALLFRSKKLKYIKARNLSYLMEELFRTGNQIHTEVHL